MWNSLYIYFSVEKKLILEVADIIPMVKSKLNYLFITKITLSFLSLIIDHSPHEITHLFIRKPELYIPLTSLINSKHIQIKIL